MADLFSPLTICGRKLLNRIALAPTPSGFAGTDGFVGDDLVTYYERRAQGGVGLIITEPFWVTPPANPALASHLGIYHDAFVPGLRRVVRAARGNSARLLLTLDAPAPSEAPSASELAAMGEAFILGTWRAYCAGADGVMLTAADDGLLHQLVSPRYNQRTDAYGQGAGRLRLALEIIEGIRQWFGLRLIIGFRLLATEFTPDGLTLQDARVLAKRVTAAGVRLLDVATPRASAHVARFPGWAVPLANSVKRITDVPVIGSGQLGDPHLADGIIREGSVDVIMLGRTLRLDPDWPLHARQALRE